MTPASAPWILGFRGEAQMILPCPATEFPKWRETKQQLSCLSHLAPHGCISVFQGSLVAIPAKQHNYPTSEFHLMEDYHRVMTFVQCQSHSPTLWRTRVGISSLGSVSLSLSITVLRTIKMYIKWRQRSLSHSDLDVMSPSHSPLSD